MGIKLDVSVETPLSDDDRDILAYPGSFASFQIPGPLCRFEDDRWQEVETAGAVRTSISPDGTIWRSDLTRIDATGTTTWDVPEWVATVGEPGGEWHQFEAAPDGSLWVSELWDWEDLSIVCDGLARFDGSTWSHYLRGLCIHAMDFAADGAVWLVAGEAALSGDGYDLGPLRTYVITPEAVAAAE